VGPVQVARGHVRSTVLQGPGSEGPVGDPDTARWTPPIIRCIATKKQGIAEVVAGLGAHRAWVDGTDAGRARRRARLAEEVRDGLREALIDAALHDLGGRIDDAVRAVDARTTDPYTATQELVGAFRRRG